MSQSGNILSTSGLTSLTGNTGGAVNPDVLGNLSILGSGSVNIVGTPGSNLLTISSSLFKFTEVTAATVALVADNGYILNRVTLITATLPAVAVVGSIIKIVGEGIGGWIIAQNASQIIRFGDQVTSTGVGGSLASTVAYDCIDLVCTVADTAFVVSSSVGNLTFI